MDQLNKGILIDNAMSDCLYSLYKIIKQTSVEVIESVDTRSMNHLSMSNLRANIKACIALMKEQQIVRQYAFKFFYLIQAIGFFSVNKVNLRNAP
jgi:hypothetical protein